MLQASRVINVRFSLPFNISTLQRPGDENIEISRKYCLIYRQILLTSIKPNDLYVGELINGLISFLDLGH